MLETLACQNDANLVGILMQKECATPTVPRFSNLKLLYFTCTLTMTWIFKILKIHINFCMTIVDPRSTFCLNSYSLARHLLGNKACGKSIILPLVC